MDNPRPEKVAVVDEVRRRLDEADALILTEYRGLKVKDMAALRRELRRDGGEYTVYKNTLVRFATRAAGLEELDALLEGPTAIAFVSGDAAAVAKTLRDFGRTNPSLVVKGAVLGNKVIGASEAAVLADLPPRDVLLARIAGGLAAPLQQFASLLQALPRNLAYGLAALRDEREASLAGAGPVSGLPTETVAPDADTPETVAPDADTPEAGTPEAGTPEAGTPEAGTPEAGTPEPGPEGPASAPAE